MTTLELLGMITAILFVPSVLVSYGIGFERGAKDAREARRYLK